MTASDVLLQYQNRLREVQSSLVNARLHSHAAAIVLFVAVGFSLVLAIYAVRQQASELPGLHGVNMHMGSRDGGGPLDFDYRLKPGVTTEANALAIARLAGVLQP